MAEGVRNAYQNHQKPFRGLKWRVQVNISNSHDTHINYVTL